MKTLQLYNVFGKKANVKLGGAGDDSGIVKVDTVDELQSKAERGTLYYVEGLETFAFLDSDGVIKYFSDNDKVKVLNECTTKSTITSQGITYNVYHLYPNTLYTDSCFEPDVLGPENVALSIKLEKNISKQIYYWRLKPTAANVRLIFQDTSIAIPTSASTILANLEVDHVYEFNVFAGVLNVIDVTPASTE